MELSMNVGYLLIWIMFILDSYGRVMSYQVHSFRRLGSTTHRCGLLHLRDLDREIRRPKSAATLLFGHLRNAATETVKIATISTTAAPVAEVGDAEAATMPSPSPSPLSASTLSLNESRVAFDLYRRSLATFKFLYGHINVPDDFEVPCAVNTKGSRRLKSTSSQEHRFRQLQNSTSVISQTAATATTTSASTFVSQISLSVEKKKDAAESAASKSAKKSNSHRNSDRDNDSNKDRTVVKVLAATDVWHPDLRGCPLGQLHQQVCMGNLFTFPEMQQRLLDEDLLNLTIIHNNHSNVQIGIGEVIDMLWLYKSLEENLLINQAFVIPTTKRWPREYWGYPLGSKVSKLRAAFVRERLNEETYRALNEIGFIWDVAQYNFTKYCEALMIYKILYNEDHIRKSFVVPKLDVWPKDLWGYQLGSRFAKVSLGLLYNSPEERQQLEEVNTFLQEMAAAAATQEDSNNATTASRNGTTTSTEIGTSGS